MRYLLLRHLDLNWRRKGGMEMVQVAILVAIAIALGLIFRSEITAFVNKTFDALQTDF